MDQMLDSYICILLPFQNRPSVARGPRDITEGVLLNEGLNEGHGTGTVLFKN